MVELAIGDDLDDLFSELIESSEEYDIPYKKGVLNIRYNLQENLEEIRGFEVTTENCYLVCKLLDPVETGLTVDKSVNFVGELYFMILYRSVPVFDKRVANC